LDHSGTSHLFNVLHLMGDQQLIDKLLRKISYRKIPFTIDFDKILKTPRDLPNTAGSELQDVYAYLTIASPFTKTEWYPEEYRKIEKYDEETYKTVYQTVSSTSGFTPDDITEFIQCNGRWINLCDKGNYPFAVQGKNYVNSIMKYGVATCFDWRKAHWGTEWGGYVPIPTNTVENTLIFETAKTDILPLIRTLSEKFPDIEIEYLWVDEGFSHICGKYTYLNGTGEGHCDLIAGRNLIADEIRYKYLKGYTSFEYDHHKHDYVLSGENLRSISLFEMMQKNDALKNYDGHKYNYNKLLP